MPTINRYLSKRIIASLLIAFLIITSIIVLVDFVETSRNMGADTNAGALTMAGLIGLNAPRLVEETIPFVVLFGMMGALYNLNRRSELIVLRASGLSAWRFLIPAVIITSLLGVLWSLMFNPLAAKSGDRYEALMQSVNQSGDNAAAEGRNIWLREGTATSQVVIHAKTVDLAAHTVSDAVFYYFDVDTNQRSIFSTRYDAKSAELKPGFWTLNDVIVNEEGQAPERVDTLSKQTSITLDTLRTRSQAKNDPPFWQVRSEITAAKKAGFDPTPMILHFHKLLALPMTLIAMTIIAAGASLNMAREGGTLKLLITGGALGFGVYFADSIISAFGETGTLPPALAAWAVPILVLMLGLVYLSKTEDG